MAATPSFANTPRSAQATLSAANTGRDGTGTVVTVFSAGASGSVVNLVRAVAGGTVTAGVVRIFMHNGSAYFLLKELIIPATTPSTSVETYSFDYQPVVPLQLPSGWSIRCSTNNAETFYVTVNGADY
jgi:hypothetical protein